MRFWIGLAACVALSTPASAQQLPRVPPVEPGKAEATFRVQDGYRLELIAAEPLVTDPVAMVYDENGLAYVVEMRDYPYVNKANDKPWEDQKSPPLGQVRLLEDTDGDGRFDRSTVFADNLSWPTGIAVWKGGVFVAATPDVWYLKDTDGDHQADVRERVFTGFRKFNVQAVMNNLTWGLDHHIYAAGSTNGGSIRPGEHPEKKAVSLGRNDFRFDPVSRQFEVLSGGARFGNTFDDFGDRFICNIRNPIQHIVLEDRYLARNPSVPVRSAVQDAAEAGDGLPVFRISPPEPWRVLNAGRLAAENRAGTPRSEMAAVGFVTSASGVIIYRGAAYPEDFDNNALVGEVAGNLVMRYRIEPKGASFVATRVYEGKEFIASTDNWFRPVNFTNAPDGTLHVLDMYRETIEHPWSIPDDIKAMLDLESGRDRGRIYRLVPPRYRAGFQPPPRPSLGSARIEELVTELENPNGWWRDTAHRLIYERQDQHAVPPLRKLLKNGKTAAARLLALYGLEGLGALEIDDVKQALGDASPRVREHAVQFAEKLIRENEQVRKRVLDLADDGDARVRLQVALTLGELHDVETPRRLLTIAHRDADDPWIRTAVLCSLPADSVAGLLCEIVAEPRFLRSSGGRELAQQLALMVAQRRRPEELSRVLSAIVDADGLFQGQTVAFDTPAFGLILAIAERSSAGGKSVLDLAGDDADLKAKLAALFQAALATAASGQGSPADRVLAIQLLGCGRFDDVADELSALLDVQQPREVQLAAANALGAFRDTRVADRLLGKYRQLTPAVRDQIIVLMLARGDRTERLFNAIEQGAVPAGDVPPVRRSVLMRSADAKVRARAEKLFGAEATPAERKRLIERYRSALKANAPPNLDRGSAVFKRECASCHRVGSEGQDVGPNLATIKGRTAVEVLEHILDPNREVSPQYMEYVLSTHDGLIKTGAIGAETATTITLRQSGGKQETLLRSDIESMASSGKSLMPEGIEAKISPEEMRDLLAFLLASEAR